LRATACPFGIGFRPKGTDATAAPFATWQYRPAYLPADLAIEFAEGTSLEEPELFYLPFAQHAGPPAHEPLNHGLPVRQIERVAVGLPAGTALSKASLAAARERLLSYFSADEYLIEFTFTTAQQATFDLRPTLPVLFRGQTPDDHP
jgi:hypothetical protein